METYTKEELMTARQAGYERGYKRDSNNNGINMKTFFKKFLLNGKPVVVEITAINDALAIAALLEEFNINGFINLTDFTGEVDYVLKVSMDVMTFKNIKEKDFETD